MGLCRAQKRCIMPINKLLKITVASLFCLCLKENLFAAWITSFVDTAQNDVGNYCSLAIDANNNPRIAYYDATAKQPKYAKWNGSGWTIETIPVNWRRSGYINPDCGQYISLAIDPSGNAHVSYYGIEGNGGYDSLIYVKGTTVSSITTWADFELTYGGGLHDSGLYTSIALDTSGNPAIVCNDSNWPDYFMQNSGTWPSAGTYVDNVYATTWDSLAIDGSNAKHAAFLADTGTYRTLRYSRYVGVAGPWSTAVVIDSAVDNVITNPVYPVSIAVDSNGYAAVAYYCSQSHHLRYVKATTVSGTTWTTPINIDNTADDTGQYASLAVDANTVPHISYYDATTQQLKHTQYISTSLTWTVKVGFSSIKPLNLSGAVVKACIAYYDSLNKKLKFAIDDDAPVLSWVFSWDGRGAKQTTSSTNSAVNFGIMYSHIDAVAPKTGYPKVHIANSANNVEISGSPFTMQSLSSAPNYVNGQQYECDETITTTGSYSYWFEAYDVWGSSATGITLNKGTVTITQGTSNNSTGDSTLNNAHPYPSFGNISNGDKINFSGITPNADVKIYTVNSTVHFGDEAPVANSKP